MYKSIVEGDFVWLSTTVLWFKRQPIQMNRQGRFFVALPVKKKTRASSETPRGKFDWKLAQFRTNASAEISYLLTQRQTSFCVRFQRTMMGSFEVEVFSIYEGAIFPRCENLL